MNEGEAAEVSSIQNPGADKWKTKHVFVSSVSKPKQSNAQQSKVASAVHVLLLIVVLMRLLFFFFPFFFFLFL